MSQFEGNIDDFGMDTISLAGPLEARLEAIREAGFTQVMLSARDLVGHAQGWEAAVAAVKASGLRVTGFQVLRDFEGLSGHLHAYKIDIAKSMLEMCHALGCGILLACSSTSVHATSDTDALVRDLRKLAMLAIPMNIKVAYEALSWGRTVNEFPQAWELVSRADMPNLGLGFDSFHMFATGRRWTIWNWWIRPRSIWCNWPTSCGTRSSRWKNASPRPGISGCFPAKVCTVPRWPH
jgi:sugar phosphate isomerase/epimerase